MATMLGDNARDQMAERLRLLVPEQRFRDRLRAPGAPAGEEDAHLGEQGVVERATALQRVDERPA